MNRRVIFSLLALAMLTATSPSTKAFDDHSFEAVTADVLFVRPLSFVATAIGSALFLVALPVSLISRSTPQTAEALVLRPGRVTFTRPIGELSTLTD